MEIRKKSFADGFNIFLDSVKFCFANLLRFGVMALLSFACVFAVFIVINGILFNVLPTVLFSIAFVFEAAGIYLYFTGYIKVIYDMLSGSKPTFLSFFEIFKDTKRCVKLFLFELIIVACIVATFFFYGSWLFAWAFPFHMDMLYLFGTIGALFFVFVYFASIIAIVLFVTRKEPNMAETVEDAVKTLCSNILPFLAIIIGMVVFSIAASIVITVLMLAFSVNGLAAAVIGIVLYAVYSVFYVMLNQTVVIKAIKDMAVEQDDIEAEENKLTDAAE